MNDVKDFLTVRVIFRKTGRARYISHLDINRTMIRALRRAQLPIWYTEGFNKHPYVTFAAPLSLGFEGERETMDIRLNQEVPMEQLVQRLDAVMPEGLQVVGAAPAVKKAGAVTSSVYRMTVGCAVEDIRAFMQQPTVTVQKRTKKKTMKELDLRPVLDAAQSELTAEGENTVWKLTLPSGSTDSVNPTLIVQALKAFLEREELPVFIRRLTVLDAQGQPFA